MSGGLADAIILEAPAMKIAQMTATVARVGRMAGVISQIELVGDEQSVISNRLFFTAPGRITDLRITDY